MVMVAIMRPLRPQWALARVLIRGARLGQGPPRPAGGCAAGIYRGVVALEKSEGRRRLGEAAAAIEVLGGARAEEPAAQALQSGMGEDALDQPPAEPLAALGGHDEDIGEIGECRVVADHPGKPDLAAVAIEAESERVLDGACQHGLGQALRPMRAGEELVDERAVEPRLISVDLVARATRALADGKDAVRHDRSPISR